MSDPVARLNAALEGRCAILSTQEHDPGHGMDVDDVARLPSLLEIRAWRHDEEIVVRPG